MGRSAYEPFEMPRQALPTDKHVTALRRRVATGDYAVNASNVANSIVRKLQEINRARRVLHESGHGRIPMAPE
jgi:hypothetical protein